VSLGQGVRDLRGHFGDNLARCRKRAGLSQDQLSVRASLHRTEISQLERGLRMARADTVLRLSGALEVPIGDLSEGLAWEPGDVRRGRFGLARDEGRGDEAASPEPQ
jgi:transcriptional regulator with XRE-family HTH domain